MEAITALLVCYSAANQDLLSAVLCSEVPATPLGSFPAIFNQALALGTLSRRRVYHEAQLQREKKQKGRKWQAGLQKKKIAIDVPHRSATNTVEASDFHWHLASGDRVRQVHGSHTCFTLQSITKLSSAILKLQTTKLKPSSLFMLGLNLFCVCFQQATLALPPISSNVVSSDCLSCHILPSLSSLRVM